jgi:hypothetical protein
MLLLVAAVSLYLLMPTLLSVFASWQSLSHLEWQFAILVLASEVASYVCSWELDRSRWEQAPGSRSQRAAERERRRSVRAGRAHAVHSGNAAQGRRRHRRGGSGVHGVDRTSDRDGAALPVLALPAIVCGAPVSHGLANAAYLGVAVLLLLVAVGTAALRPIGRSTSRAAITHSAASPCGRPPTRAAADGRRTRRAPRAGGRSG